jgi:cysteine desulfurase
MGHDAIEGAVRVSIGHSTTAGEIAMFRSALAGLAARRPERTRAA